MTTDNLEKFFDIYWIQCGYDLLMADAVEDVKIDSNRVTAKVHDSKDSRVYPVTIELDEEGNIGKAFCICPKAEKLHHCKHEAAVALSYMVLSDKSFDLKKYSQTMHKHQYEISVAKSEVVETVEDCTESVFYVNGSFDLEFIKKCKDCESLFIEKVEEDINLAIKKFDVSCHPRGHEHLTDEEHDLLKSLVYERLNYVITHLLEEGECKFAFDALITAINCLDHYHNQIHCNISFIEAESLCLNIIAKASSDFIVADEIYTMLEKAMRTMADRTPGANQLMFAFFSGDWDKEHVLRIIEMRESRLDEYISKYGKKAVTKEMLSHDWDSENPNDVIESEVKELLEYYQKIDADEETIIKLLDKYKRVPFSVKKLMDIYVSKGMKEKAYELSKKLVRMRRSSVMSNHEYKILCADMEYEYGDPKVASEQYKKIAKSYCTPEVAEKYLNTLTGEEREVAAEEILARKKKSEYYKWSCHSYLRACGRYDELMEYYEELKNSEHFYDWKRLFSRDEDWLISQNLEKTLLVFSEYLERYAVGANNRSAYVNVAVALERIRDKYGERGRMEADRLVALIKEHNYKKKVFMQILENHGF